MKTYLLLSILFFCIKINVSAQNLATFLDTYNQYYTCGNINITGKNLTVEALIKLDGSGVYVPGKSTSYDIVSKHYSPVDVNYLLRPDHCELTTTSGFYRTVSGYPYFSRDSFYHVAMTYDGSYLMFYVNGCLFDKVAASGNIITNDFITTIGRTAKSSVDQEQFYGYIDEVRIWSVTRTQSELAGNMLNLKNPTTTAGLLAYYKFEGNSKNIQGNSAFDAVPVSNPRIQEQNNFLKIRPLTTVLTVQQPSCNKNDGQIVVNARGGMGPFLFSIDGVQYQTSNVFSGLKPGKYTLYTKTNGIGCTETNTTELTIPAIQTRIDTVINISCYGKSDGVIKISGVGSGQTFQYSLNNNPFQENGVFANLPVGDYSVSIKNNMGCSKEIPITIVQPNPIEVVAIVRPDTCTKNRGSIQLTANGGNEPYRFEWSTGNKQSSLLKIAAGSYSVNISDNSGCFVNKAFLIENVTARSDFQINPVTQSICAGDTTSLEAKGGTIYTWYLNDQMIENEKSIIKVSPSISTSYKVNIEDTICGYKDFVFATVNVNPLPKVSITKSNDIDCSVGQSQLVATGGDSYIWYPSSNLSNDYSSNLTVSPSETTTYHVYVASNSGCRATDSITVQVLAKLSNSFNLPSAFTPNHDGKNDCFRVKYWGNIKEFSLSIYNRWGSKVFATTNPSDCWDGIFKGEDQPAGVYVYFITAKTLCGNVNKKGTIVLIR